MKLDMNILEIASLITLLSTVVVLLVIKSYI